MNTPTVSRIIITCWAMSTVTPPEARTSSKSSLPSMPPTAAPTASSVPRRFSTLTEPPRERSMLVAVMASTVQPDRKLTVATPMPDTASRTGLIITPPPTPLMPPAVVAARHIRKNSTACSKSITS